MSGPYQQNPYGYPPPAGGPSYAYPPPSGYPAPQGGYGAPPPGYNSQPQGGYVQPPPPMGFAGVPPGYGASPQAYAGQAGAPPKPPTYQGRPPAGGNMSGYDAEAAQAASAATDFINKQVRSGFVRKVFILVFLQLAATVGITCIFLFVEPVNVYIAGEKFPCRQSDGTVGTCRATPEGQWVFYTSWALTLVMLIALMCSTSLRRKHPWNYLAMFVFTAVMSVQVGCLCAWWDLSVVLQALAVTGAAVFGLTLAALFIPWDITKRGNVLAMAGIVVFFIALMTFFVGFFYVNKWWYLAISVVFALLFSAYLVYDIQMLVGKGKFKTSPDEYVWAATQIYLDIVLLFLQLLSIIGIASR